MRITIAPPVGDRIGRNGHVGRPIASPRVAVALPPRPRAIFLGGADVEYVERAPGPNLAPWVQSFWRLRCVRPTSLRVLPDGCMDIIDGDVVGSLSSVLVADLQPGDEAIGVRLRPGAFTALYGVPADELTDVRAAARATSFAPARSSTPPATPTAPTRSPAVAMAQPDLAPWRRSPATANATCAAGSSRATGHSPRRLARIGRMQAAARRRSR